MFMPEEEQKQMNTNISQALQVLQAGAVVGYPTETVWGLATLPDHVSLLYQRKERDLFKAVQISCANIDLALALAQPHPVLTQLTDLWPGPLTIVTPARPETFPSQQLDQLAPNGMVGLRVPHHPVAQALLKQTALLATTSLNPSGQPTARTFTEAQAYQLADYVLPDPQPSHLQQPSTVILLSQQLERPIQVLRQGALPIQRLQHCLAQINIAVQVSHE